MRVYLYEARQKHGRALIEQLSLLASFQIEFHCILTSSTGRYVCRQSVNCHVD